MKKATIIRDKLSGLPFAILLPSDGKQIIAFGSVGQGEMWADWAMQSSSGVLDNLDVSLSVEKDVELTDDFINSLESSFSTTDINDLKFAISKKAILVIQHTKSLQNDGPTEYEQINEENEDEDISNWPIVDAAIATIDVAYKQRALDYKAKAFNLDSKRSSILLQVKGVRAMWDPNMPGGGGWRCPDSTPYGGQFTNRLGRGCTFGAIRRIGRALMTASLKDIAKGFDNDEVAFPSVYRAGKKLDEVGDKLRKQTGQKYAKRAVRRANQLKKEKARKELREGLPTFRQRYESLGPSIDRRGRVLIAAAQVVRDFADDQATRAFVAESRRAKRRQGIPTPKDQNISRSRNSGDGNSPISGRMSADRKEQLEQLIQDNIFETRGWKKEESILFNPDTDDMSNVGNPTWPGNIDPLQLTSVSRYKRGPYTAEVFRQRYSKDSPSEGIHIVQISHDDDGSTRTVEQLQRYPMDEILYQLEGSINYSSGDLPPNEGSRQNDAEIERRWRQRDMDADDVTVSIAPGELSVRPIQKPLVWERRVDAQDGDVTYDAIGNNPAASRGSSIYTIHELDPTDLYVTAIHGYDYQRDGGTDYDEEYFDDKEFSSLDEAKKFVQELDDSRYRPDDDDDPLPSYGGIRGEMSSKRREQIAQRLRSTAQNILEGRRFSRRQKRDKSKNSPYLSPQDIRITELLIGGQIDSILQVLEDDLRGRQYIADAVNAMNDSMKPLILSSQGSSLFLYHLSGLPGKPNPGYSVATPSTTNITDRFIPYSESDFTSEDVKTFRAALSALKTGKPFQKQKWGRFEKILKLYALTRSDFDPTVQKLEGTNGIIKDDIPLLAVSQGIPIRDYPGIQLPDLFVDAPSRIHRRNYNPDTYPLHENRPLEELEEVNNLYATIGLLMLDARGLKPHDNSTFTRGIDIDDVQNIADLYATHVPDWSDDHNLSRYKRRQLFAQFIKQWRESSPGSQSLMRRATGGNLDNIAKNLISEHREDLRIFLHNLWYGRTQWNSPKRELNNKDDLINKRNSIVERFVRGLSPSRDKESSAIRRELRGRTPRSTTRLRERLVMRSRRKAKIQAGEIQSFDDAPEFEQPKINRPESPGGPRKLREFLEFLPQHGTSDRATERFRAEVSRVVDEPIELSEEGIRTEEIIKGGRKNKEPRKVDPILRDFADHLQPDDSDSAAFAAQASPENAQKLIVTTAGLDDLDRFFRDEVNHAAIARARDSVLSQYDWDHQEQLNEMYINWLMSFHDPAEGPSPGGPSNMRLTELTTKPWVMSGEPGFLQDDMDEAWLRAKKGRIAVPIVQSMIPIGERIVLRALTPDKPVVYIEDSEAQVAHLMTPEGKHLMSIVTSRYPDEDGKIKKFFIAGSDALRQIEERKMRKLPERIRKLSPRERRRTAALDRPKRPSRLAIDDKEGLDGTTFGKTTSGLRLAPRVQADMDKAALARVEKEIEDNLDILENSLRRELQLPDKKQPISTKEAVAKIAEIRKTSPRRAAILETDLHNMVALARAQESGDINYINDLKPGLRNRMLQKLQEERVLNSNNLLNRNTKDRYEVLPHDIIRKRRPLPSVEKIKGRSPVIVSESILAPQSPKTVTGPELTPGVGNPQLGITYDKLNGLYVDSATGDYIEDYSGLPIEQTAIFEPIPLQERINYPRVIVSPPGILPSIFATLAPGTNPDNSANPRDVHTPTFREAINAFAQSLLRRGKKKTQAEQVVQRILQKGDVSHKLRGSLLAMIDARGWKSQIPGQEQRNLKDPYFVHELGLMSLEEVQGLAIQAIEQNPDLPLVDLGITYADVYPNSQLGSSRAEAVFKQQFAKNNATLLDGLGLDTSLEPAVFYLPGENVNGNFINDEFLVSINRALQLQHAVDTLNAKISGGKFVDDTGDPTGNAQYIDARKAELIQLREEAVQAWIKAAEVLSQTYTDASRARNEAAEKLSNNPKNATAMDEFLRYGAQAEAAKMLLDRHITSNPVALDALQQSSRAKLESLAKQINARKRRQIERAKARAGRAIPRNEGAFDNNPELLDPHGTTNPPSTPRSLDEVLDVVEQHRSEGLFDDPALGLTELSDEQIDALADLQELATKYQDALQGKGDGSAPNMFTGIPNTPLYGVDFDARQDGVLEDVLIAHFQYVNGASSLPVLASKEEIRKMLTELDANQKRRAIPMARGLQSKDVNLTRQQKRQQEEEWGNLALRGDRFVAGRGGKMEGHGEYWSIKPGHWVTFHGEAGTLLGVLTEKTQIFHKDVFEALFPTKRGGLYEAMWGLYNAIGAPGSQGVETSHGQRVAALLPPNSLLPDPNTGQFSVAQIAQLEDAVAKLTAVGQEITATKTRGGNYRFSIGSEWGSLTIEGSRRDYDGPGTDNIFGGKLFDQMLRDKFIQPDSPRNIEIIEQTKALRERINAWYAQHLSWFVQLAQMRQDESQPGQAGIDAKAFNKRLTAAWRSIMYLKTAGRASMLGVDAFISDVQQDFLPSVIWEKISDIDNPEIGNKVIMLNRSGMIYHRTGLAGLEAARAIVEDLMIVRPGQPDTSVIAKRAWG